MLDLLDRCGGWVTFSGTDAGKEPRQTDQGAIGAVVTGSERERWARSTMWRPSPGMPSRPGGALVLALISWFPPIHSFSASACRHPCGTVPGQLAPCRLLTILCRSPVGAPARGDAVQFDLEDVENRPSAADPRLDSLPPSSGPTRRFPFLPNKRGPRFRRKPGAEKSRASNRGRGPVGQIRLHEAASFLPWRFRRRPSPLRAWIRRGSRTMGGGL